ncbi:Protein F23F1.2 [Aphelenchoides avenae]|nr:Protein F23F1.2 [Aphelenchus avenae]
MNKHLILLVVLVPLAASLRAKRNKIAAPADQALVDPAFQSPPFVAAPADGPVEQFPTIVEFKPETNDELFARLDSDGDGSVNADDFLKRDQYFVQANEQEFDNIDGNHDGKLSKKEFDEHNKKLEEEQKKFQLESSKYTVQQFDKNGDGQLSEEELKPYVDGHDPAALHDVVADADKDKDEKLNVEEFSNLEFNFPWDRFAPLEELNPIAIDAVRPLNVDAAVPEPRHAEILVNRAA